MQILFLCVANSARSQMAEGLAREILGPSFTILSAGSKPTVVNPKAITVMQELDVNLSAHSSDLVDDIPHEGIDLVITLCQDEVCPLVLSDCEKLHWPMTDPANPDLDEAEELNLFRQIRDQIKEKIEDLKKQL